MIRKFITTAVLVAPFGIMPWSATADVPNVFTPGTVLSSSQLNDNFANLDERLAEIEVEDGNEPLEIDCAGDSEALQNAIEEAEPGTEVLFSNTCDPIEINVDGLTIEGTDGARILASEEVDAVVTVELARDLTLINFEIDGNGVAEFGLVVEDSAFVTIEEMSIADATDAQALVTTSSTLKIDGDNELGEEGNEVGVFVTANSLVLADEANHIVAETAIECEFGSMFIQESADGVLNVDGAVSLVENCTAFFSNALIGGEIEAQQSSVLTLEAEDGSDLMVEDGIHLSSGSHMLVGGEGNVEVAGDAIFLLSSTVTVEQGLLSADSIQAHSSSRLELKDGAVISGGTDVLELHSFSVLQSDQVDDAVTADQVVCSGVVSGLGTAGDLCQ